MSQRSIRVAQKPIHGQLIVPGSKSISNRALLLAALQKGRTILRGVLASDDTEACIVALQTLGVGIRYLDDNVLEVIPPAQFKQNVVVNCRDAGTVARFLTPILAGIGGSYKIYGSKRLQERPMKPLLDVLIAQGVEIQYLEHPGFLPIQMKSRGLKDGEIDVNIQDSSQFVSGLMMAGDFKFTTPGLEKKPYVEMTRKMMAEFKSPYQIEPDASTASYFFAAAALTVGQIFIPNMHLVMLQGDLQFLTVLEQMGVVIEFKNNGVSVKGTSNLCGLGEIDMTGFTDTFMTLAAIAPFADKPTIIKGLRHTRLQESDRVAAMAEGLTRLGARVETTEDSITIYPSKMHGGTIDSHNDHRIAMSHALIGLKIEGVIIEGAECVKKTCPNFFELLESLY